MSEQAKFCPRCGSPTVLRTIDNHERAVCERCGHITYRNPVPAAGIILIKEGNILMVRRKFEWTLPAGFLEYNEHVEACAVREAEEETGLRVELTRLFGAYMAMDDPRVQVVLLLYLARRTGGELTAGDDASEAAFFALDATPEGIAFKAHEQALADVRRAFAVR